MPTDVESAREFLNMLTTGERLRILLTLDDQELSVSAIAMATGMTAMKVTQCLIRMRLSGAVESRRDGLQVYYRINSSVARKLTDLIKSEFGADTLST
jgi:DNA-binding transcriptional ArsR family regulator